MKRLLIVWHSRTGAAQAMAEAAARGAASEPGIEVALVAAARLTAADIIGADGYLFAAPENLGTLSGAMKEAFDRTYYDVIDRVSGRPYAQMIAAGSDGTGAARQLARIVTGWRLRQIAEPLILCTQAQTAEAINTEKHLSEHDLAPCTECGAALAVGLNMGIF